MTPKIILSDLINSKVAPEDINSMLSGILTREENVTFIVDVWDIRVSFIFDDLDPTKFSKFIELKISKHLANVVYPFIPGVNL